MYDAVLFDLDDTLVDFSLCEQAALRAGLRSIAHAFDVDGAWAELYAAFVPHSRHHWQEGTRTGVPWIEIPPRAFEGFLAAQGQDASQAEAAARAYSEHFADNAFPHDGAIAAIRRLEGQKPIGLISNGIGILQRGRLRSLGLERSFDPLLISEEIGIRKPDRRIFEMAIARFELARDRILFVGDSITDDLVGSKDAGLRFCHYAAKGAASYPPGYEPDHVVADFGGLMDLLGEAS